MKSYSQKKIKTLIKRYLLALSILLLVPVPNHGKPLSKVRQFLNLLHFNFSTGYTRTSYESQVFKLRVFSKEGVHYLYNSLEGAQTGYVARWFGKPYIRTNLYESDSFLASLKKTGAEQEHAVNFYGTGYALPISLSGHVDIKKKWRVEIGGSIYLNIADQLVPEAKYRDLGAYYDPDGIHYSTKLFVLFGHKLIENAAYSLLLNTQLSYDFVYGNLFKDATATISNMGASPAIGIGLTLEKHISEYFSVFGKLMYEKIPFENEVNKLGGFVRSMRDNISFQVGVTINSGEIPQCSIPNCEIEVKHRHADDAYRGVSLLTGKKSIGYRLYKK